MNLGHVGVRPQQVADELMQRFAALPMAFVSDQMGRKATDMQTRDFARCYIGYNR